MPLLACSFLLLTADDEEFYEQGNPLTLRDNVRLVTLLRDGLWQLIWTEAPSSGPQAAAAAAASPASPAALRAAATASLARLFAQLHARNGRRRFAPPEAFFREELSRRDAVAERLLADAAAADADADMDADGTGGAGGAPDAAAQPASRAAHLLAAAPALAPFHLRAALFQELCAVDRDAAREGAGRHGAAGWDPLAAIMGSTLTIRRDHLFEDGLSGLGALPAGALRGPVRIRFVNALGAPEAGVDGGGLFKDFLDDLVRSAFDPRAGLWRTTPAHALYPSPASGGADARHLEVFRFQGAVLAKALFEGMLAELPFAGFFLSKLRGDAMELNDLASLDEALYRSLLFLKRYEGDHAALCLFFTTTRDAADAAEVELVPRGRDTPVSARNKLTYIHLVANYKLTQQMRAQCDAFLQGFHSLIRPQWVRMFSADELQQLIGGSPEGVSVADLRRWTSYSGGFTAEHPTVLLLWEVVAELAPPQQAAFLKFVTACSRAPLLGFRTLEPRFCVHRAGVARSDAPDEGADLERLPTAATCMVRSVRADARCRSRALTHACGRAEPVEAAAVPAQGGHGAEAAVRHQRQRGLRPQLIVLEGSASHNNQNRSACASSLLVLVALAFKERHELAHHVRVCVLIPLVRVPSEQHRMTQSVSMRCSVSATLRSDRPRTWPSSPNARRCRTSACQTAPAG
jgi:ubiquitin-protein ligase E3 C